MPFMNTPNPTVRLKNAWRSSHPWIFQKLVEKPAAKPKSGTLVEVVGVDGEWIGRGFYNGQLGDDAEATQSVRSGSLEMVVTGAAASSRWEMVALSIGGALSKNTRADASRNPAIALKYPACPGTFLQPRTNASNTSAPPSR